ncbi:MAG: hypothetical protein IV100_15990 [Myxococcales bacterium]|nr:hypothetical protein [Myxococcales bacterium]
MKEEEIATGRGKKFDQTRRLIAIAMREGMTQDAIARECRTVQSVVSGWAKGQAQAREHQLRGLIERFGHLLNRPVRELYLVEDVDVAVSEREVSERPVEESDDDVRLPWPGPGVIRTIRTRREARFVEVTGAVVWRHTFTRAITVHRGNWQSLARDPVARWLVHRQKDDRFQLVRLARRRFTGSELDDWQRDLPESWRTGSHIDSVPEPKVWVESIDDAARWSATIEAPRSAAELVSFAKDFVAKAPDDVSVHDRLTLVFRLVRALHGLGINVSEVERA